MDQFFSAYFLLDEFAMMGLALAMVMTGAVLVAVFIRVKAKMRRVTYIVDLEQRHLGCGS